MKPSEKPFTIWYWNEASKNWHVLNRFWNVNEAFDEFNKTKGKYLYLGPSKMFMPPSPPLNHPNSKEISSEIFRPDSSEGARYPW